MMQLADVAREGILPMAQRHFSPVDREQLHARGITEETALAQIALFQHGIPYTTLHRPCTVGDGITVLPPQALEHLAAVHAEAALAGRTMKFVPASGAASRMFKLLLSFLHRGQPVTTQEVRTTAAHGDPECREFLRWLAGLQQFAFYNDLHTIMAQYGLDLSTLLTQGQVHDILEYLLTSKGLDYANLPKGLLQFHRYPDHCRTPLEEHLVEAAAYSRDQQGLARLHFTVTPEHQAAFCAHLAAVRPRYETQGVRFEVTFSTQHPSTDTIAVDPQNQPFRDPQGHLLFRPAGHGALLENLHALQGDIVYIKNIDNVVPDHLKTETYLYKRALGGYLVEVQNQVFTYLRQLSAQQVSNKLVAQIFAFARETLSIVPPPALEKHTRTHKIAYLKTILHRPIRVCGMVQNAGEPGGGPFWVQHADGSQSLQIVETSQVDMHNAQQKDLVAHATHFNPVDLVCGVRDYEGKPFNLLAFTDPQTGFISMKSHEGRELKALELPGLWNGAMAHWNTLFVEVPLSTFNPVKTVLDLLRPQHQT
jgi:hypothetical protein